MPPRLTRRQKQIWTFIGWFVGQKGYPPTRRQIGMAVRIKTPNGVSCHLTALQRKGYLKLDAKVARGIRVLNPGADGQAPPLRIVTDEPEVAG
jgi:repressor LexA